eukprot:12613878-Heterocapsa_arctica.AAC.1
MGIHSAHGPKTHTSTYESTHGVRRRKSALVRGLATPKSMEGEMSANPLKGRLPPAPPRAERPGIALLGHDVVDRGRLYTYK